MSDNYSKVSANLSQVSNNLAQTEVALKASQEETAKRDAKIAELEAQNQALDKQAVDLSTAITNLTTQIEETKRKLAASEGEKGFLEKELKRLMAEKAELETAVQRSGRPARTSLQVERGAFGCPPAGVDSPGPLRQHRSKRRAEAHARRPPPRRRLKRPQAQLRSQRGSQRRRLRQGHPAPDQPSRGDQSAGQMTDAGLLIDSQGRILRDLRVSLTDRCNFRCLYCLPETEAAQNFYRGHWAHLPNPAPIVQQWVPGAHILSFEEIERVIRLAVSLGIQKVRLTGGEPLLRHNVEDLVARIASDSRPHRPGDDHQRCRSSRKRGARLRAAGLRRISFSLDSLARDNFRKITGRDGLEEVLSSIRLAQELGLHPVKVNAVIIRGLNDHEIEALAGFAQRAQPEFALH